MRLFASLLLIALAQLVHGQNTVVQADYWFDEDIANLVSVFPASNAQLTLLQSIPTDGLTVGAHTFNLRFKQSDGKYSAPLSSLFVRMPAGNSAGPRSVQTCEYWFDNDYGNSVTLLVTPATQLATELSIAAASLSKGSHILHMRFKDNSNIWSAPYSHLFINRGGTGNQAVQNVVTACRYWVDADIAGVRTVYFNNPAKQTFLFRQFNFSHLDTGMHVVHYQFKDTTQAWSLATADSFYKIGRPRIDYITPNQAGNGGGVTIAAFGNGLDHSPIVRLEHPTLPTIQAHDTTVVLVGHKYLQATFDLAQAATGIYNYVVELPGDTAMTLYNAFKIDTAINGAPTIDIIGPSTVLHGNWNTYNIVVTNHANNDISMVPAYLSVQDFIDFRLPYERHDNENGQFNGTPAFVGSVALGTSSGGSPSSNIIPIITPVIPAGQSVTIPLRLNSQFAQPVPASPEYPTSPTNNPNTPQTHCIGGVPPPEYYDYRNFLPIAKQRIDCALDLIGAMFAAAGAAAGGAIAALDGYIGGLTDPAGAILNQGKIGMLPLGNVVDATKVAWDQSTNPNPLNQNNAIKKLFFALAGIDDCFNVPPPGAENPFDCLKPVSPVASLDPNYKVGPSGYGEGHYFVPGLTMPYAIFFENSPAATAPAHQVRLTDTLSPAAFDLTTFTFGNVYFGEQVVGILPGSREIREFVDLRPYGKNTIVEIEAGFDQAAGVASWTFTSLDANTEAPSIDPFGGFLPPNTASPNGQGSVLFSISPKDNLSTNESISNKASIVFDNNGPIVTPAWVNTVDKARPESQVAALPEDTQDTVFQVHWNGTDSGSGIRHYSVFVSRNGGSYKVWKHQTTELSADFVGMWDSTYSFYSIATDQVGNKELSPAGYDATTRLVRPSVDTSISLAFSAFPNPTTGRLTIVGTDSLNETLQLSVINSIGQTIATETIPLNNRKLRKSLDFTPWAKGYYTVVIEGRQGGKHLFHVVHR